MDDDDDLYLEDDTDVTALDDLGDESDLDGGIIPDDYDDLDDDVVDDEDDYDDYEDATEEDVDFVVALYREDGTPIALDLGLAAANDLEELIDRLRRLPGDAGALGAVSIDGEFFVLCRVRGRQVQVLLNDSQAANDWPIARDVVDYLGLELPDPEDEDSEAVGDLTILVDQGLSEFDLEQIVDDMDEDSDQLVHQVMEAIHFDKAFDRVVD